MARFFVFVVVVGTTGLIMVSTRPSQADYLHELQRRADAVTAMPEGAFDQIRGAHPLDAMVAAQSPAHLMEHTRFDDYYVVSVFTTEYEAPRYGPRRVRTFGLFSMFVAHRLR